MQVDNQDRFFNEILDMSRKNFSANNSLFSKERIEILIRSVKRAKDATKPTGKERTLLKQYEILTAGTLEKLIKRKTSDDEPIIYFVAIEEMYAIIKQSHTAVGHGGLHKTYNDLKTHYANISREAIKTFLKLCDHCALKKKRSELSKLVIKPVRSSDFSSRGQVDLIDYQYVPDSGYKWVLHYQDHFTKFSILRSLKSKTAAEVAYNLLDIFLILGAPMILQSDNGREFTANIITELTKSLWPDLKIVHGRPRHPQSQGSVERANADVKEMLATWLSENNSTQWSEGLRFIQFQKNRSYHRVIGQFPYKALFGSEPKVGLSSSSVPRDLLPGIQTEEDLEAIYEASSVPTDNTDSEYPVSETEHNTDTEIETDKTMSESDITTDKNTETELNGHDLAVNIEQVFESETDTLVIESSDANMADEASISVRYTAILPRKRALSGGDLPHVNSSEDLCDISNIEIKRARKRALSGQQVQADALTKNTKARLTVLCQGDNVIIPIPSIDRGPADERNIKGVVMNVNEHGGYKIGTKVGQIKGYLSRNQVQFFANATLKVCEVPMSDMSVREIVRKISLSGGQGQGFVHCQCKKGSCKSGRCKCRRMKVLCNSRCHMSLSCSNK